MHPLGKAMKIRQQSNVSEQEAHKDVLNCYRQTPHSLAPGDMFRDGLRTTFPRKEITAGEIKSAEIKDSAHKENK